MKLKLLVLVALLAVCASASFAQKINTDWDRQADFSQFHTYAWQKSPNPAGGLWDQRITDGIDKELAAKGLKKVDSNPDLWVVYSNTLKDQKSVVGTGYNFGGGWGWGGGWGPGISTVDYNTYITKTGTLVVELASAQNHMLMWRGSATDTLSDNSDKNIKTLNNALNKLFKNYPPKGK
jgi:Domain of unknown function (DUF4136)